MKTTNNTANSIKAVILAAGIASRMRPLTDDTPKCLLKVGERTLLGRTLDALLVNGIDKPVIVTGYLHEEIENFVRTHYPGLSATFIYNPDYATTNNIYSLWLTKKEVIGEKEILLMNADILFDPGLITLLLQSPSPDCLAMNSHELGEEEMKIIVNSSNEVIEISKTCPIEESLGESMGIEKISKNYLEALFREVEQMIFMEGKNNVFREAAFDRLIHQGYRFIPVDTGQYFSMELDTVEDFQEAINRVPKHLL